MGQLPTWLASASPWMQVFTLACFAIPGLLAAFGALLKSNAESKATEGLSLSDSWGKLNSAKDAEITRLETENTKLRADRDRGWNLARGAHELARWYRHGWVNAVTAIQIQVDRTREAIKEEKPLEKVSELIDKWKNPISPPELPALEDVKERLPEEFNKRDYQN